MARRQSRAKRASIVETALRAFGERGFGNTTIKRIATRAGIAPGSIYTYFKDKDELFRHSVDEGWRSFLLSLDGIIGSAEPQPRRLERLLDTGFTTLAERLPLVRGIVFEAGRRDVLRQMIEQLCLRVEQVFAAGPAAARSRVDRAHWLTMLRVTVAGIMFTAAAAPPGRAPAEIAAMRRAVSALVMRRAASEEVGR